MLGFLRRHQRYFFVIITFVIVISFSFFGTYSTIAPNPVRDQVAFTAIDGTQVPRYELEEMALFLGTDAEDKLYYGGLWGPNFLNDGVIKKDFLETGLAPVLASNYSGEIKSDLYSRLEKEKKFTLYKHPYANFINAESAWAYFAPTLKGQLQTLQTTSNPEDSKAFAARVNLFLEEKKFPAAALRHVLAYQEKQYGWVTPDPSLEHADLSLFGYHTLEDWFGPRFIKIVSEFIINAAKVAEARGYRVTKEDALTDLLRNSEKSFQENLNSPHLGVASGKEYFSEQLRRMGLDQTKAVKIWQQVMLFRRLFHDLGNSMFIDPIAYRQVNEYAMEMVEGDLYRLPETLRLGDFRSLQKLEAYLSAVSSRPQNAKALLQLPTTFFSPADVAKKYPELVQKRYTLEVASVDKKMLQTKVGVREAWNWEVEEANWEALKKQFPELGTKNGKTREERLAALDSLDVQTRGRVDAFARAAILEAHPEILTKALESAPPKKLQTALHETGGNAFVEGLKKPKELIRLLDEAPLGKPASTPKEENAEKALSFYTADQNAYYRIRVLDRSPQSEILTFAEADREGVLDKILDSALEAHYKKIQEENPAEFKQANGGWKPFNEVKDEVANRYFEKILTAIRADYASSIAPEKAPEKMIGDYAASLRLFAHARNIQAQIEKNPEKLADLTRPADQEAQEKLSERKPLKDQWRWEQASYQATRGSEEDLINKGQVFNLNEGQWTKVHTPPNGDLSFFLVKKKGNLSDREAVAEKVSGVKQLLSNEAQQQLANQLVFIFKEKGAISLDYLNQSVEMSPEDPNASYGNG